MWGHYIIMRCFECGTNVDICGHPKKKNKICGFCALPEEERDAIIERGNRMLEDEGDEAWPPANQGDPPFFIYSTPPTKRFVGGLIYPPLGGVFYLCFTLPTKHYIDPIDKYIYP